MNMFADLANNTDIQDEERDVLGGSFAIPESDAYKGVVKVAYITVANSGAKAVNVTIELETGTTVRETMYVTSGTAKGGNNYYVNAKGEKKYLPGYLTANTLCELGTGKGLTAVTIEEKVLNLYNAEAGKEVPTKVPVIMDLLEKEIMVGLIKVIENKRKKNDVGEYVDTAESRELAEIDKVFYADGFTKTEKAAGQAAPEFVEKWRAKWKDQVKDRRTIKDGVAPQAVGGGFTPNAQAAQPAATQGNAAVSTNSLFG